MKPFEQMVRNHFAGSHHLKTTTCRRTTRRSVGESSLWTHALHIIGWQQGDQDPASASTDVAADVYLQLSSSFFGLGAGGNGGDIQVITPGKEGRTPLKPVQHAVAGCDDTDGPNWATYGLAKENVSPWALLVVESGSNSTTERR